MVRISLTIYARQNINVRGNVKVVSLYKIYILLEQNVYNLNLVDNICMEKY